MPIAIKLRSIFALVLFVLLSANSGGSLAQDLVPPEDLRAPDPGADEPIHLVHPDLLFSDLWKIAPMSSLSTQAQPSGRRSPVESWIEDLNREPLGLEKLSDFQASKNLGAFSIHDSNHCSREVGEALFNEYLKQMAIKNGMPAPGPKHYHSDSFFWPMPFGAAIPSFTIGQETQNALTIYNDLLQQLKANGDILTTRHHVCVGFFDFGFNNAFSNIMGYIAFDPRSIQNIGTQSGNMFSVAMLMMHEFAHQIQYWHAFKKVPHPDTGVIDIEYTGVTFEEDANVRRLELVADCLGAALTAMVYPPVWDRAGRKEGFEVSARLLGDNEVHREDHHGNPMERLRMTSYGFKYVDEYRERRGGIGGLTSTHLLKACESKVEDFQLIRDLVEELEAGQ